MCTESMPESKPGSNIFVRPAIATVVGNWHNVLQVINMASGMATTIDLVHTTFSFPYSWY